MLEKETPRKENALQNCRGGKSGKENVAKARVFHPVFSLCCIFLCHIFSRPIRVNIKPTSV